MTTKPWRAALRGIIGLMFGLPALAADWSGTRNIVLSNATGERHIIGQVVFSDASQGKTAFRIEMAANMQDYFLAMRPFLCLTGPVQRLCWFPVHNEAALVSKDDLLPLEYALMFMRTRSTDLHVNPFYGLYYRLRVDGDRIAGTLFEVDMAPFIAPDVLPVEQRQRPLKAKDFYDADPVSNWLPLLSIE
jgi:hypothetical protein